eukprot:5863560-Ditylum_brightwellii.AAC.1
MNTEIITTTAATAVSTITDDLRLNKKSSTDKEAPLENDVAENITIDDSESTLTTTSTTESNISIEI